jgi:hypothetical protein
MRRLYLLVPDIPTAKKIVDDLLLARISERHLHVLAKRGTPLEDLPEAGMLQKTNLIHAMERGVALGGASGLLAGLVAITLPGAGPVVAGGALLGTTLTGAGVGAWAGSFIGLSVGNSRLKRFEEALEGGELLVMADVPASRTDEIEERIRKHFPEAEIGGTEPRIPAFP